MNNGDDTRDNLPIDRPDGKRVPATRTSRFFGLAGMTANIAGNLALDGLKAVTSGQRPNLKDLAITPQNAQKITQQLSNMRGAAMKLGQMMSLDSGDFLPAEFADILARLRAEAQHMPKAQLDTVLTQAWGENWEQRLYHFNTYPIAAASIGQVHRAYDDDGQPLAIKVQYPGVKESIDSDIKNVAALLRLIRVVPSHLDLSPLIEEGRLQLHQEADYEREAKFLQLYGAHLNDDPNFIVPKFYPNYSTDRVLAMSYEIGQPIESVVHASQDVRNSVAKRLIDLTLKELFEFGLMQTDPNFANYQYNADTDQIILLDFGATREISDTISSAYAELMRSALRGDVDATFKQGQTIGFISPNLPNTRKREICDIIALIIKPAQTYEPFDFAQNRLAEEINERMFALIEDKNIWHLPPPDYAFIQRKLGGMYLLATRLKAKIDIRAALEAHL